MLWWYWRSDSCSNRLFYYKDPHLSLATGILYNFHTAFAIMVKHSCLCLVTWNNSGHYYCCDDWRSDSCSNRLFYYKDPHLSLATGILYNFHTAFAIMVKHSCLCLVTWNNSGHIIVVMILKKITTGVTSVTAIKVSRIISITRHKQECFTIIANAVWKL